MEKKWKQKYFKEPFLWEKHINDPVRVHLGKQNQKGVKNREKNYKQSVYVKFEHSGDQTNVCKNI